MTEEKNPRKTKTGIFLFLGKRIHQRRAFHIPTAPAAAATLGQNPTPKGAFLRHRPDPSLRLILRLEKTITACYTLTGTFAPTATGVSQL
jgi:hypothetical protein